MSHDCHDPNCEHDDAYDAALALAFPQPTSAETDLQARLRRAVTKLVAERIERGRS